jgi:hypothetical protein
VQLYAGLTSDSLRGYMDELKFYDHGLTPGELELLNKGTAANDAPAATISTLLLCTCMALACACAAVRLRVQWCVRCAKLGVNMQLRRGSGMALAGTSRRCPTW